MMGVEGDDDSWTVDCLRRRLIAERAASKVAKEDAELMGRKLIELERQLKLEIELRNRAEKKLKFATKKLESLKFSAVSGRSSSPESKDSDERNSHHEMVEMGKCKMEEKIKQVTDPFPSEDFSLEKSATVADNAVDEVLSYEQSSSSADSSHSCNNEDGSREAVSEFKDSISSTTESMTNALRQSSVDGEEIERAQDQMEYAADNSLAIVPAEMWPEAKACEPKINNIHDVLLALRHAKEHLQSSIGIRSVVRSPSFRLCGM